MNFLRLFFVRKTIVLMVFIIGLMGSLSTHIFAQKQSTWEKTPDDRLESRKFRNNYFHSIGFVPFMNFFTYHYKYETSDPIVEIASSTFNYCIFTLQYDARYNLFNYHDFLSVSLSSSPMAALAMSDYKTGMYYQLPIGLDLNLFLHSTYNNINNAGFSFGGGINFIRASEPARSIEGPDGWKEYYARVNFKFRKYKYKSMLNMRTGAKNKNYYSYIGIQIGRGKVDLEVNGLTLNETNKTFRLVFGKILSY